MKLSLWKKLLATLSRRYVPRDGAIAFGAGYGLYDNPFARPSAEYEEWRFDWLRTAALRQKSVLY